MKRIGSAIWAAGMLGLAACESREPPAGPTPGPYDASPAATAVEGDQPADAPAVAAAPATAGAPSFAVIYPGGALETEPVTATAEGSDGGMVTYLTDADPEAVIAFHRRQAEAAGLASIMAMNQGDARAYGAAKAQSNLQVVASPTSDGRTSVQLSWSAAG